MDKRQLIEEIRKYNSSAEFIFLQQFDEDALQQYLDHLIAAERRDKRIAGWVRTPQTKLRMVS